MGLDFYTAKTYNDIDTGCKAVSLETELQDYLYVKRDSLDSKALYSINPYGDTEFNSEEISEISSLCKQIINSNLFDGYNNREAAAAFLLSLDTLCEKASEEGLLLFAIGD